MALAEAVNLYLHDPNVTLVDLGYRLRSAQGYRLEPELAVRVHVRQKLRGEAFQAFRECDPDRVIDADRVGFPTDVLPALYRLHRAEPPAAATAPALLRPDLRGGVSNTHPTEKSHGTSGRQVRDRRTGEEMILSSWHALSSPWHSRSGALAHQPRGLKGAGNGAAIATFVRGAMHASLDTAVARPNGQQSRPHEPYDMAMAAGVAAPRLGMHVIKSGGATGVSAGIITGVEGYAVQRYAGIQRVLHHVIHIMPAEPGAPLCASGDSGAWWLEAETFLAVGLHIAGSAAPDFGLAHAMPEVLEALEVDIEATPAPAKQQRIIVESAKIREQAPLLPEIKPSSQPVPWDKLLGEVKGLSRNLSRLVRRSREKPAVETPCTLADPPSPSPWAFPREPLRKWWIKSLTALKSPNFESLAAKMQGAMAAMLLIDYRACLRMLIRNWPILSLPAGLVVVMSLMGARLDDRLSARHEDELQRIVELQPPLSALRATVQFDSVRRVTLDKVLGIIDQYNLKMPSDLKLKIADEIYLMNLKYRNLDVELICATITHETGHTWNPRSLSWAGARGLMQIMPATGRMLAEAEGLAWDSPEEVLFDPILNIRLGCRYLSGLVLAYSIDGGLAAYNGGEKRAERWLREDRRDDILAQETRIYVPAILKIYDRFRE